jgi:YVTN family beta-propeller protein
MQHGKHPRVSKFGYVRPSRRATVISLTVFVVAAGAVGLGVFGASAALPRLGVLAVGNLPTAALYAPSNHELYVASFLGNVSAYNSANHHVKTIPVPVGSLAMAYDPLDSDVYVAEFSSNVVSVINTSTNIVTANIPVGSGPQGIAFDAANGAMYVTNELSDNISVIPSGSYTASTSIALSFGSKPAGIVYDSANSEMYVAESGGTNVDVIDSTFNAVVAAVGTGSSPFGVAFDSANQLIYVSNEGSDNLTILDSASNAIVANLSLSVEPGRLVFNPGAGDVLVTLPSSDLVDLVSGTNNVTATVNVGSIPIDVAYDAANGRVYVVNEGSATLSYFTARAYTTIATINLPYQATGQTFDPVTNRMVFFDIGGICTATTANQVSCFAIGSNWRQAIYDPTLHEIFVVRGFLPGLYAYNASTLALVGSTHLGSGVSSLALDPRNGVIYVGGGANITGVNASTLTPVSNWSLTATTGTVFGLAYDPVDGYLYAADGNGGNISILNPVGGTLVANLQVFGIAFAAAYIPATQDVYVADAYGVEIVSSVTHHVVRTIGSLTGGASGVGYDPATQQIVVTGYKYATILSSSGATAATIPLPPLGYFYYPTFDPANAEEYISSGPSGSLSLAIGT